MSNCNCEEKITLNEGLDLESAIHWLDERNTSRIHWLARQMKGESGLSVDGVKLADSIDELKQLSVRVAGLESAVPTIIFNQDQLIEHVQSESFSTGALSKLNQDALEKFISQVQFADLLENGERIQYMESMYFGDLLNIHGLTYDNLFDIYNMFGYSDNLADKANHKFGCTIDPMTCQRRAYYSCGYRNC